jgi:hypothetical protein
MKSHVPCVLPAFLSITKMLQAYRKRAFCSATLKRIRQHIFPLALEATFFDRRGTNSGAGRAALKERFLGVLLQFFELFGIVHMHKHFRLQRLLTAPHRTTNWDVNIGVLADQLQDFAIRHVLHMLSQAYLANRVSTDAQTEKGALQSANHTQACVGRQVRVDLPAPLEFWRQKGSQLLVGQQIEAMWKETLETEVARVPGSFEAVMHEVNQMRLAERVLAFEDSHVWLTFSTQETQLSCPLLCLVYLKNMPRCVFGFGFGPV